MDELKAIEQRTLPHVNRFVVFLLLAGFALLCVFFMSRLADLRVPAAYLVPLLGCVALWFAVAIYRSAVESLPVGLFFLGLIVVAGGAAFDVFATLVHSPTLKRESNPIARALLDSGHPLQFIYLYGFVSQILYVSVVLALWAAFLRHRKTFIQLVLSTHPKSLWEFYKTAGGGNHLSWRQFFFPLTLSELPNAYYALWTYVAITLVCGGLYRWWLGLEWFGLVPNFFSWQIAVTSALLGLVISIAWLAQEYAAWKNQSETDQQATK